MLLGTIANCGYSKTAPGLLRAIFRPEPRTTATRENGIPGGTETMPTITEMIDVDAPRNRGQDPVKGIRTETGQATNHLVLTVIAEAEALDETDHLILVDRRAVK